MTYIDTSTFVIPLIPKIIIRFRRDPSQFTMASLKSLFPRGRRRYEPLSRTEDSGRESFFDPADQHSNSDRSDVSSSGRMLLEDSIAGSQEPSTHRTQDAPLTLAETAKLGLEFCLLWFMANYFVAACLEYTTVASSTIVHIYKQYLDVTSRCCCGCGAFLLQEANRRAGVH